jgi:hypothetical protein
VVPVLDSSSASGMDAVVSAVQAVGYSNVLLRMVGKRHKIRSYFKIAVCSIYHNREPCPEVGIQDRLCAHRQMTLDPCTR